MEDKLRRARFFQETFLLANISTEVVLGMPFLILNNANVQFVKKELTRRFYTTAEALLTIKQVEFINKKKFAKAALDKSFETFIAYMTSLVLISAHLDKKAQIVSLLTKKIKIPNKYSDFVNIFSKEKTLVLPK